MMISSNVALLPKRSPIDLPASHRFGCSAGWAAKTSHTDAPVGWRPKGHGCETDATPVDRRRAENWTTSWRPDKTAPEIADGSLVDARISLFRNYSVLT